MKRTTTKTYIDVIPCNKGHFEKYVSSRQCIECIVLYNVENKKHRQVYDKEYYQKNKEKMKSYRDTNPIEEMFKRAKVRANRKGLEFNITISDIVIPKYCPIFPEMELILSTGGANGPLENTPSLDRVDNNKGYVKGNVKVISHKANSLKRDGTVGLFKRLIEYIESSSQEKN